MAQPVGPVDGRRRVALVAAALGVCLAVSVLGRGVLVRVAEIFPDALPPNPYFQPGHALLLYIALPVVLLATLIALLAPGILAVAASGGSARAGDFAIKAFGLTYALRVAAHSVLALAGVEIGLAAATAVEVVLDLGLAAAALARAGRADIAWPTGDSSQRRRLLWMAAIPVCTVLLLLPMIFWQDLTDDGLEALDIGRSLATHVVPRFPNNSGLMGLGIGMLAMAPPVHWFVTLMGPLEAAARLPLVLYLPILFGVLLELIEWQSPRAMDGRREPILVLALAVYVVTMSYSASYAPYSADVSAPAAFETLTVLCIAAGLLFLWQGHIPWLMGFVILGYLARPTGLLVPLLLAIAAWLAVPDQRRAWLRILGLAVLACLAVMIGYEKLFIPFATEGGGPGYPSASVMGRIQFLYFTDWRRLLYVAVPGGIMPMLALAAWKRQDALSRQVSVFCLLYFLFFYPQAFVALHHFVPVMILPLVVLWRLERQAALPWLAPVAAVLAALSLWLSLPPHFRVDRTFRRLGAVTDYRIGNYFGSWQEYREAIRMQGAVDSLFRREWHISDPARELVGTPTGLIYYADRAARDSAINYIVQRPGEPLPAGFTRVASHRGVDVYVRDLERWRRDRSTPPPTDFRSPLYAIPRETLFRFLGIPAHHYHVDLSRLPIPGFWRLF